MKTFTTVQVRDLIFAELKATRKHYDDFCAVNDHCEQRHRDFVVAMNALNTLLYKV